MSLLRLIPRLRVSSTPTFSEYSDNPAASWLRSMNMVKEMTSRRPVSSVITSSTSLPPCATDRSLRSEERREGKEGVRTCKSRWSPTNEKIKEQQNNNTREHTKNK